MFIFMAVVIFKSDVKVFCFHILPQNIRIRMDPDNILHTNHGYRYYYIYSRDTNLDHIHMYTSNLYICI